MVKLPNQMGKQIIALLTSVKDSGKALSSYRDYMFANWRPERVALRADLKPSVRNAVASAHGNWRRDDEVSLDDMFDILGAQVNAAPNDSSLIIDRVAEILLAPHAREMLSARTLEALRRAVLNSNELTGLEERLATGETHCVGCQKTFQSGETTTLFHEPNNRGILKTQLYCTKCLSPSYMACSSSGCTEAVPLSSKQLGFFAKKNSECEHLKLLKDRAQQTNALDPNAGWVVADIREDIAPPAAVPAHAWTEQAPIPTLAQTMDRVTAQINRMGQNVIANDPVPQREMVWNRAEARYVPAGGVDR